MNLPLTSDPQFNECARLGAEAAQLAERFRIERDEARRERDALKIQVAELSAKITSEKL